MVLHKIHLDQDRSIVGRVGRVTLLALLAPGTNYFFFYEGVNVSRRGIIKVIEIRSK